MIHNVIVTLPCEPTVFDLVKCTLIHVSNKYLQIRFLSIDFPFLAYFGILTVFFGLLYCRKQASEMYSQRAEGIRCSNVLQKSKVFDFGDHLFNKVVNFEL